MGCTAVSGNRSSAIDFARGRNRKMFVRTCCFSCFSFCFSIYNVFYVATILSKDGNCRINTLTIEITCFAQGTTGVFLLFKAYNGKIIINR